MCSSICVTRPWEFLCWGDVADLLERLQYLGQSEGIDAPLLCRDDRERPRVLDQIDAPDVRGHGGRHPGHPRGVELCRDEAARLIDRLQTAVDILRAKTDHPGVHDDLTIATLFRGALDDGGAGRVRARTRVRGRRM